MNKTKTIKCSCHSELLLLEWDEELEVLDLSIWAPYGSSNKMSWRQRLRYCWQILTGGKPYGDQMVLDKQSINAMVEHLNQFK